MSCHQLARLCWQYFGILKEFCTLISWNKVKLWMLTSTTVTFCRSFGDAVWRKHPSLMVVGIFFHHDNIHPYTARKKREKIEGFRGELLKYTLYSPDLALSDYHLLIRLNCTWGGKRSSLMKMLNVKFIGDWCNCPKDFMQQELENSHTEME